MAQSVCIVLWVRVQFLTLTKKKVYRIRQNLVESHFRPHSLKFMIFELQCFYELEYSAQREL